MDNFYITSLSILCYLLATSILALHFTHAFKDRFLPKPSYVVFGSMAVALHAYMLYHTIFVFNNLDLGFFNAFSLVAWLITATVMLIAPFKPVESLLVFIYPVSIFAILMQANLHETREINTSLFLGMEIHILLSVMAYSLLAIATLQSLVLYIQEYALRKKHLTNVFNILPPMQIMENLLIQLILIGFFLLSLSLASGMMFVHDIFAQHLIHKTVLSLFAWFIYGILLWGRWSAGWRGITLVKWALGGFISLVLAYFGSKLVLEIILNRT